MFVDNDTLCMCQLAGLNSVALKLSIFYCKITSVLVRNPWFYDVTESAST